MRPPRASALALALAAAGLVVAAGCAATEAMARQSLFDAAPKDLPVQAVTVEVTGRRATLWGDEEAEARLRRAPGVHQVARGGGRNTFIVLTDQSLAPEALKLALEGDFNVVIGDVVKR